MTYERHYVGEDRLALDAQAIQDIRDYVTAEQWDILQQGVGQVLAGELTVGDLNMLFSFAGVSGRPFHAFCRKYCLDQYREWMSSTDGGEPIVTDEAGFRVDYEEARERYIEKLGEGDVR